MVSPVMQAKGPALQAFNVDASSTSSVPEGKKSTIATATKVKGTLFRPGPQIQAPLSKNEKKPIVASKVPVLVSEPSSSGPSIVKSVGEAFVEGVTEMIDDSGKTNKTKDPVAEIINDATESIGNADPVVASVCCNCGGNCTGSCSGMWETAAKCGTASCSCLGNCYSSTGSFIGDGCSSAGPCIVSGFSSVGSLFGSCFEHISSCCGEIPWGDCIEGTGNIICTILGACCKKDDE